VARVRARPGHVGFMVNKVVLRQVFFEFFGFPLPVRIPQIAPQSLSSFIIWGCHNRPNSGRSIKWTQSHRMKKIKNNKKTPDKVQKTERVMQ
jgi:hypothetical protein